MRSLLTTTRNDEELRRKELELAAIKERAQREKEVLESLKMISEAEKWKVEESLEAEQILRIDKDSLLDRSRKRELEDDVAALQADLDTLGSQLDRAMANHKATEEKSETIRVAFEEAAEHLVRFKAEQKERKLEHEELSQSLQIAEEKVEGLQSERDELRKLSEDSKRQLSGRKEDLARVRDKTESTIADLEAKLVTESRNQ